ncbi:MAG: hypothetical protein WCI20_15065 [bacterium]
MSVETTQITCSTCAFTASDSVTWGYFSYELKDNTLISVERSLGWCHNCNDVVAIENLTPKAKRSKDTDGRSWKGIAELKLELQKAKSRLRNIFGFGKAKIDLLTNELEFTILREREIDQYNKLIESRVGSSRCLFCSMRDILHLNIPKLTEGNPPVSTGFIHPECGGQLMAAKSGFRVSLRFDYTSVYDCEGHFLRKQQR